MAGAMHSLCAKSALSSRPAAGPVRRCALRVSYVRATVSQAEATSSVVDGADRFRLSTVGPMPGAKTDKTRKGRGISAGQGATCGFGMRGQKSRSGTGTRPGFEGGQNPLYRRLPKLKGVAGGMPKGRTKFNTINVRDLASFAANEEITLETVRKAGILKPTGAMRELPLKILGEGDISSPLTVRAGAATAGAVAKLEAAGCTVELGVGVKQTWRNKNSRRARRAAMREAGELAGHMASTQ